MTQALVQTGILSIQKSGATFGRSEGLAIASLRLFEGGVLSQNGLDDPLRVDAAPLTNITPKILASVFQVSENNPLVGLEERAKLLNKLGQALIKHKYMFEFGDALRPVTYMIIFCSGKKRVF